MSDDEEKSGQVFKGNVSQVIQTDQVHTAGNSNLIRESIVHGHANAGDIIINNNAEVERKVLDAERARLREYVAELEEELGVPGYKIWRGIHLLTGVDTIKDMPAKYFPAMKVYLELSIENAKLRRKLAALPASTPVQVVQPVATTANPVKEISDLAKYGITTTREIEQLRNMNASLSDKVTHSSRAQRKWQRSTLMLAMLVGLFAGGWYTLAVRQKPIMFHASACSSARAGDIARWSAGVFVCSSSQTNAASTAQARRARH